jgi:signal transduction histidine kinase
VLGNAVKFTPPGGRVDLRAERDGEELVVRVSDSGIGIPAEDQAHVFGRFFRSSTVTLLAIPGAGLGLSIAKAIVEEHGGSIAVESEEGTGTTVTVRLPLPPDPLDPNR